MQVSPTMGKTKSTGMSMSECQVRGQTWNQNDCVTGGNWINLSSQLLALTPILLYTGPIFGCFILSQILYQFTSILPIITQNLNDTFYTLCLVSISFWPSKYRFKLNGDLPNTYTGLQEIHLVSMHWKHLDLTELTTLRSNLLAVISPSFSAGMC